VAVFLHLSVMDKTSIIGQTRNYIQRLFKGEGTGHDYLHIERVVTNALQIQKAEGGDRFIVEMGALLHDVGDHKLFDKSPRELIGEFLNEFDFGSDQQEAIISIAEQVSFKGKQQKEKPDSLEGEIVQDADRLDAIGAIGIARTFTYGGSVNQPIFDPELNPTEHNSFEEYKKQRSTTINHFYEKLLLLKDRMNTITGKKLAAERHRFMVDFLNQFYSELDIESPDELK
jgi:uncharacterized protein